MKLLITPMFSAEPWLKSALLAGSKLSWLRPSKPGPKTMVGFEQLPRSRAELVEVVDVVDAVEEEAGAAEATPGQVLTTAAAAVDEVAAGATAAADEDEEEVPVLAEPEVFSALSARHCAGSHGQLLVIKKIKGERTLLGLAVAHGECGAAVGGIGTGVELLVAAPLLGGGEVDKGVAADFKRTLGIARVGDGRGGQTAQGAGEGL
jgi:hypothetical protein